MNRGKPKIKVAVVGARGYSGLQLCRLLLEHENVELSHLYSRNPEWKLADEIWHPLAQNVPTFSFADILDHDCDTVFFATPIEVSSKWIPKLIEKHKKVIDLSGAYRFSDDACYGLVPWQEKQAIQSASIIANPGCYATSVLLALLPLLKEQLIDANTIAIDSKSGVSGAGRSASEPLLLGEIGQNFYPYKVGCHQHVPEIEKYFAEFAGNSASFFFNSQLIPVERGICTSIYCNFNGDPSKISEAFSKYYGDYPFLHYSKWSEQRKSSIKSVNGTPMTHIRWHLDGTKLYLFSFIDNLMKGAASQAVENFNLQNNLNPTAGLMGSQQWIEAEL